MVDRLRRIKQNESSKTIFLLAILSPFKLIPGGRAVGWLERDVDAWLAERCNDSRSKENDSEAVLERQK